MRPVQTLWFERLLLPDGWAERVRLVIRDGRIAEVVRADPGHEDECHPIALPGLCNVHSHGFQRGMAGLTETRSGTGDDFWSWRSLMYRFLDRLDPNDIAALTALAYVEMLESGYTRVGEFHYLHNDPDGQRYADPAETAGSIVSAATTSGIGLTLLPVFYAHGGFGGAEPEPRQRRFLSTIDSFAELYDASRAKLPADAAIGIAPHSLRAVAPDELAAILPLAGDGPVHIHAAEQVAEVEACQAWSGARPVEWLLANAPVDRRWCLVHATHMSEAEARALAASGAVAGLCPTTEANLGDGIFPAVDYLAAGGSFGTGSDSNIFIDAAGELRMIEYAQRLQHRRRALLADSDRPSVGARLFAGALAGGAQALGVEAGIRPGAPADLFSLDAGHPSLACRSGDDLIDGWIFAARERAIDCVWRGGRKLVMGGRHHRRDEAVGRFRRTLRKLLA